MFFLGLQDPQKSPFLSLFFLRAEPVGTGGRRPRRALPAYPGHVRKDVRLGILTWELERWAPREFCPGSFPLPESSFLLVDPKAGRRKTITSNSIIPVLQGC